MVRNPSPGSRFALAPRSPPSPSGRGKARVPRSARHPLPLGEGKRVCRAAAVIQRAYRRCPDERPARPRNPGMIVPRAAPLMQAKSLLLGAPTFGIQHARRQDENAGADKARDQIAKPLRTADRDPKLGE